MENQLKTEKNSNLNEAMLKKQKNILSEKIEQFQEKIISFEEEIEMYDGPDKKNEKNTKYLKKKVENEKEKYVKKHKEALKKMDELNLKISKSDTNAPNLSPSLNRDVKAITKELQDKKKKLKELLQKKTNKKMPQKLTKEIIFQKTELIDLNKQIEEIKKIFQKKGDKTIDMVSLFNNMLKLHLEIESILTNQQKNEDLMDNLNSKKQKLEESLQEEDKVHNDLLTLLSETKDEILSKRLSQYFKHIESSMQSYFYYVMTEKLGKKSSLNVNIQNMDINNRSIEYLLDGIPFGGSVWDVCKDKFSTENIETEEIKSLTFQCHLLLKVSLKN